jgi:hypothetical protein
MNRNLSVVLCLLLVSVCTGLVSAQTGSYYGTVVFQGKPVAARCACTNSVTALGYDTATTESVNKPLRQVDSVTGSAVGRWPRSTRHKSRCASGEPYVKSRSFRIGLFCQILFE